MKWSILIGLSVGGDVCEPFGRSDSALCSCDVECDGFGLAHQEPGFVDIYETWHKDRQSYLLFHITFPLYSASQFTNISYLPRENDIICPSLRNIN